VPLILLPLGRISFLWYVWAVVLLAMRFLRTSPIYDPVPLDPPRRLAAALTLALFILCFIPAPLTGL
jgi:hypothetical protein